MTGKKTSVIVGVLYLAPGDVYFKCRHCNNLSYRSRNRCGLESWGETSREIDKLWPQIKRWTWRGRPTRKVRKLRVLEQRMEHGFAVSSMLLKQQGNIGEK